MTDHSLQAVKVLAAAQDAYWAVDEMSSDHPEDIAAAVAKELADQVVPEGGAFLSPGTAAGIRAHILAIAGKLRAHP